ncbi:type IV toxin-antitoxin system AbiEi family antitoxin [Cellulomonas composti]|uniref:type IV toxin-antitoxin system AbiEi family antitoxin n=1 Tax=Cellulomonas composti TaxID=266130 RepID=UPI001649E10A|nr:type IV toxin-antitoxin system AbiEi family antitoxin [Cellulomonas composti]
MRLGRLDTRLATALDLPTVRPLLLLAPHISDAVGEVLRARGVDYADAAGNTRLAWDGLLIDVRGRPPRTSVPPRIADRTAARAFSRAGSMVTFALLSWTDLPSRPVREIAATCGVAVGTVHGVLHDLAAAGYLSDGAQGRALNRGGELLGRWAEAYTVTLARRLAIASFGIADLDRIPALEADLLGVGAQLGGELAASRLDAHLHPSTSTFYVDELPSTLVARYRLRPDEAGVVRFRSRFWHRPDDTGERVPSPLIYADLVSSGDPRQREHAERIRAVDDRLVELDRT